MALANMLSRTIQDTIKPPYRVMRYLIRLWRPVWVGGKCAQNLLELLELLELRTTQTETRPVGRTPSSPLLQDHRRRQHKQLSHQAKVVQLFCGARRL